MGKNRTFEEAVRDELTSIVEDRDLRMADKNGRQSAVYERHQRIHDAGPIAAELLFKTLLLSPQRMYASHVPLEGRVIAEIEASTTARQLYFLCTDGRFVDVTSDNVRVDLMSGIITVEGTAQHIIREESGDLLQDVARLDNAYQLLVQGIARYAMAANRTSAEFPPVDQE